VAWAPNAVLGPIFTDEQTWSLVAHFYRFTSSTVRMEIQ
jgi:hypothetical protein